MMICIPCGVGKHDDCEFLNGASTPCHCEVCYPELAARVREEKKQSGR